MLIVDDFLILIKGKILIYINMFIIFRVFNFLCFIYCIDGLNIMLVVFIFMLISVVYRYVVCNVEYVELFFFMF